MCAYLNVENLRKNHDKVLMFEKDLHNFHIKLLPKSINSCDVQYKITKKRDVSLGIKTTQISPSIMCKGVGLASAEEIMKHAPYEGLRDLAERTDSSIVDQDILSALFEAGFFKNYAKKFKREYKTNLTKESLLKHFVQIRADIKKANQKGLMSQDMFGDSDGSDIED
jgi:DNA polymerase III alpha subunit